MPGDGKIEIETNEGRWVSNESAEPHFVELNFETPIEVNALRVVSGQVGPKTPMRDFVLQYRKNEDANSPWIDIESSRAIGNLDIDFSARFEPVQSQFFRLWITSSPGNLARLWELELYRINENSR